MGVNLRRRRRLRVAFLILLTLFLAILAWPREDILLKPLGVNEPLRIRKGLDLQGGAYLVYEAELDKLEGDGTSPQEVVKNAAAVIERRINPGGANESIVQTAAGGRIVVQIPSISDPSEAIKTIGRTAQLEFYEIKTVKGKQQAIPTNISGKDIQKATVDFVSQTSQPIVSLQLKGGESTDRFAELTTRLAGSDTQLVTLLDKEVVFGPAQVQTPITNGQAQLSGNFNIEQAKEIATLLNAGALPVPVKLVAQQTIGPTLGAESVKASVIAAAIGLLAVIVFLLIYYRTMGVVAVGALAFYSLALLSIIKLSVYTPYLIVLTLAGIAGFILSVAVAVDASILIMERIKEESAHGSAPVAAVSRGFEHAWSSIRDANITAIIGAAILYWFGAPLIKGFALTLGIGIGLNLITVKTFSRAMMDLLARGRFASKIVQPDGGKK